MRLHCPFCRIVAGREPARVVHRTARTTAFLPLRPATPGHTLVVPNTHVPDFFAVEPALAATLTRAVLEVATAVRAALDPAGMNIVSSAGKAASQSVYHLHTHVVPRWAADRMGAIWPPPEETDDRTQDEIAERIRAATLTAPPTSR
ncbi:HIT family protein [Micromonospora mirobrigensis]|uniref:Histidine triad (HIT) family protein n=1 Tax=Micromonospora mirobrigensis TaxID=262898 RepID=A0A1C4X469_9ACTN|nr:HIT family protein [Micromonospora mirobrigensis]SCF03258.1 histidine triad (HIT) family protein [Micromonospora mirobrigensis]